MNHATGSRRRIGGAGLNFTRTQIENFNVGQAVSVDIANGDGTRLEGFAVAGGVGSPVGVRGNGEGRSAQIKTAVAQGKRRAKELLTVGLLEHTDKISPAVAVDVADLAAWAAGVQEQSLRLP